MASPPGSAPAAADPYGDGLIAELHGRPALAVLEETTAALEGLLASIPPGVHDVPEPGKRWSIRDVVEHLADGEVVFAYRIRRILVENGPVIDAYDQEQWVERLVRTRGDLAETLDEFAMVRRRNVRFFRSLTPAERRRHGVHRERGVENLDRLLGIHAGHDLRHLGQVRRIMSTLHPADA